MARFTGGLMQKKNFLSVTIAQFLLRYLLRQTWKSIISEQKIAVSGEVQVCAYINMTKKYIRENRNVLILGLSFTIYRVMIISDCGFLRY